MGLSLSQPDLVHFIAQHFGQALLRFIFGIVSIRYAARRGWFRYWDLPTPTTKQTIGLMLLISILL